jgi:hypothetical protein
MRLVNIGVAAYEVSSDLIFTTRYPLGKRGLKIK